MADQRINLMGAAEIADRLGCSRQRVYQLAGKKGFPQRITKLAQGMVWDGDEIEAWMVAKGRPLRRPSADEDDDEI